MLTKTTTDELYKLSKIVQQGIDKLDAYCKMHGYGIKWAVNHNREIITATVYISEITVQYQYSEDSFHGLSFKNVLSQFEKETVFNVHLSDDVWYESIEADDEEEAIDTALEWFAEREPNIKTETIEKYIYIQRDMTYARSFLAETAAEECPENFLKICADNNYWFNIKYDENTDEIAVTVFREDKDSSDETIGEYYFSKDSFRTKDSFNEFLKTYA